MKHLYTLLILQILFVQSKAQTVAVPCDSTPTKCSWDLRVPLFNIINTIDGTNMTSVIVCGNGTNPD